MAGVDELVENANKLGDEDKVSFLSEFISKQNALFLANAVKALEEKFGVQAQAVQMVAGGTAPAAQGEQQEEKSTFNIVAKALKSADSKLNVIKAVRAITNLGLKESKEMVEKLPQTVKSGVPKDEAAKIKDQLEKAGAEVELK